MSNPQNWVANNNNNIMKKKYKNKNIMTFDYFSIQIDRWLFIIPYCTAKFKHK